MKTNIIGLFLILCFNGQSNQKELEANFVPEFLAMSIGNNITLGDQFSDQFANAIVEQQKATLTQIQSFPELDSLVAKSDSDGLALAAKLDAMKTAFASESTKKSISDQLKNQKIDIGGEIVKQLPIMETISKSAWIIYAISGLILVLFISNLFVKNIAAFIYWAILLVYPKSPVIEENNSKKKTEEKKKI